MTNEEIAFLVVEQCEKLRKQIEKDFNQKIKKLIDQVMNEHEERYEHERRNDPWY